MAADAKCLSQRGERGRGRLAVYGPLADPDNQGAVVLPAYARTR